MPPDGHTTITLPDELVAQIDRRAGENSRADALRDLLAVDAETPDEPFSEQYLVEPELLEAAVRTYGGPAVVEGFVEWGEWLVDAVEPDRDGVNSGELATEIARQLDYTQLAGQVAEELEGRMQ